MNEAQWRSIDDLFQRALMIAASERDEFVRREAGDDAEVLREVCALLAANEHAGSFLEEPALGGVSGMLDQIDFAEEPSALVGQRIGPYELTRVIATGGMGTVYLAGRADDEFRRQVAIKVVRQGLGGSSTRTNRRDELLRRFHVERQVLADLDHPYIGRLLDGGTTADGRPYFVMEYIEGRPIDVFCEQAGDGGLTQRQRLHLFCKVCDAVQHAHQSLVIHRDLKPSNILVTESGMPKLLDFGLAKLLDPHRNAAATGATVTGEFMGTFAYAAPEQVSASSKKPDTRSDVYALGMILYRLLAGRHAYAVTGTVSQALCNITETMPDAPSRWNPAIDDELDTIVLKALAKEQDRRYQSAGDLGEDIHRYLRGEPILAKGDSGWYMLRKNVRRYRLPLAVAAGFLILISGSAVLSTVQAVRVSEQAAELARTLRISNIERGRVMGISGSTAHAENLLWREYLKSLEETGAAAPGPTHGDQLAYWALWELYFNQPCTRTLVTDESAIRLAAASPDARWLVICPAADDPVVLDYESGEIHLEMQHHAMDRRAVEFHPHRNLLASAALDGAVELWDVDRRTLLRKLSGSDVPIGRVAFSRSGELLVTSNVGQIQTWNADQGTLLHTIVTDRNPITDIAINPDQTRIATAGEDGRLRVYEAVDGTLLSTHGVPGRRSTAVGFSPDGRYLAADTNGTRVQVVDMETVRVVHILKGPAGWINAVRFHPSRTDPYLLTAASVDRAVYMWEIPSGRLVNLIKGHDAPLKDASFMPDGDHILTSGLDRFVRCWEIERRGCLTQLREPSTALFAMFSPDGQHVISGLGDGEFTVRIRDAATGDVLQVLEGHEDGVAAMAVSRNGRLLASGSYDDTVRLWRLEGGLATGEALVLQHPQSNVNTVAFSPDAAILASADDRATIRLWRTSDGGLLDEIKLGTARIASIDISPDGRFLAATMLQKGSVMLLELASGRQRELTRHSQFLRIVRFSPDGTTMASAGDGLTIRLWDMQEPNLGGLQGTLTGHQQDIFALAFSPDGTMLASAGRSGIIKLWDVARRQCLVTLTGHTDMVFALDFGPDGRTLLSASRDRTLGTWDLTYYDRHIRGNEAYQRVRLGRLSNR